jgi:hypothetical protein
MAPLSARRMKGARRIQGIAALWLEFQTASRDDRSPRTVSKRPHPKKKPRPRPGSGGASETPRRTLRVSLEGLEIARGHDGFLCGKPEPALLIAAYRACAAETASLVGRVLVRAKLEREMPCRVELGQQELRYGARFAASERLLVLAFAVEEDSGAGVQALYAAFETPQQLLLYDALESEPVPRGLDEWARAECTAPVARAVEVLLGEASLEQLAGSDDYVAAAAFSVGTRTHCDEIWRLPFVARDTKNDWTLALRVRVTS